MSPAPSRRSAARPVRLPLLPTALALALLLAATALRAYHFNEWPPGLSHDEAINGIDALRLLRTGVIPLYTRDGRPEPLFRFAQTLTIALVGPTLSACGWRRCTRACCRWRRPSAPDGISRRAGVKPAAGSVCWRAARWP